IMVDEYQDTNGAQLELLFSVLNPDAPNLCCVGDDDQAIFRFQGATLSNFRILKKRLPDLKTVSLINNYRSTGDITDVSGKIISQLPKGERMDVKQLKSCRDYDSRDIRFLEFGTEEEELAFMVGEIKRQGRIIEKDTSLTEEERKKPYNSIAVLVRKRRQILKVIEAFLRAGIPYATDGKEDIRCEKRVRQILDVLKLASSDAESVDEKSLVLYRILTSDYIGAEHSDVLKFVHFVNIENRSSGRSASGRFNKLNLFQQFQEYFGEFTKDADGSSKKPDEKDPGSLSIVKEGKIKLKNPYALHVAAWAIERVLADSDTRPIHDMIMRYIDDTSFYKFILKRYEHDKVLRMRDLRSLVSFISRVKQADLARPGLKLKEFMDELELMEMSAMPLRGNLATLSQDGVCIYTAHGSKGREFYTVFLPFCLQGKSWPSRGKSDIISIPPDIFKSKERVEEKQKRKDLDRYDELRLFYVASSRAKAHLFYTATPADKTIVSPFMSHLGIKPEEGAPTDEEKFLVKLLEKTFTQDPFSDTEEVLKDIVSNLSLNPTSLNNYIKCPRKFLYDNVLMLPGRKKQQLIFGNCAHKALEDVYAAYMKEKKFPPFSEFKNAFIRDLAFQGASEAVKTACMDKLERVKDWYKREEKSPVVPIELENKLEVTLPGGIVFRGTFDKIEQESVGEIKVVDYKTGKPDKHVKKIANCRDLLSNDCDDYFRQLIAYKMLYEKYHRGKDKDRVTKGVLQFLDPVGATVKKYDLEKGSYRNEVVELTDSMVGEFENAIQKCWKDMQTLKFDKLEERDDKERCRFCDFDSICWG
ncbi:MAG: ATP-dependent helicase, partial [Candidatus Omnitrophica bacterium]|nr:ATP-dependent helicase [Candidatus Omnitrophota bacterium]